MKITKLRCFELNILFNISFKHSSATRNKTESIIVEMVNEKYLAGYGEGCPRSYVTSESVVTAKLFFNSCQQQVMCLSTLADLKVYITENKVEIDKNPAAWCAIELAFLDLLAKDSQQSVESLLGCTVSRQEYNYSAILGDSRPDVFHEMYQYYRKQGFTDFKIKLSDDSNKDYSKLAIIKKDKSAITVRADANNLWKTNEQAVEHLSDLDFKFSAIEEPLKTTQIQALSFFVESTGIKIILDESFLRYEQIDPLLKDRDYWVVNLRVSKLGGLIRSLHIVEELVKNNILINVGAQVGETSLLTRAGLIIADAASANLLAQEGAFSTRLLKVDPFVPNIQFGYGGNLKSSQLDFRSDYGFGMEFINSDFVKRLNH